VTSESSGAEERRWLVDPPGPQQIKFQIAAGDQAEVTPELRQALDGLLEALTGTEVEGYANSCGYYIKGCGTNTFGCHPRGKCTIEWQSPCVVDYGCRIAPFSS
jgi:hypothetical protein